MNDEIPVAEEHVFDATGEIMYDHAEFLAEREACAAIADRYAHSPDAVAIAVKIRARG